MTLILDAGALVAVERHDRRVATLLKRALADGEVPVTHGGVLAQVWRGGRRSQANLAELLPAVEVVPLDEVLGRRAGILLGRARARDVVDAALVSLALDGDEILTSDVRDVGALAEAADLHVELIPV